MKLSTLKTAMFGVKFNIQNFRYYGGTTIKLNHRYILIN